MSAQVVLSAGEWPRSPTADLAAQEGRAVPAQVLSAGDLPLIRVASRAAAENCHTSTSFEFFDSVEDFVVSPLPSAGDVWLAVLTVNRPESFRFMIGNSFF